MHATRVSSGRVRVTSRFIETFEARQLLSGPGASDGAHVALSTDDATETQSPYAPRVPKASDSQQLRAIEVAS